MKLKEIFDRGEKTLSFEVFPPKVDSAAEGVRIATEAIAALQPDYMSVTYGAGGGTSKYTLELARNIEARFGVPTLAHLTCVSSTRATVADRLADISALGIKNVMALRGDIPEGMRDTDKSRLDYRYAVDLIREIRARGLDLSIGAACYPEVHPESESLDADLRHLKEKADAGADFLTTQMFFDNTLYYTFLDRARAVGIDLPVVAGIMPITAASQIKRAIELSGSFVPGKLLSLVEKYGSDPAAMRSAGIEYAIEQIEDLYSNGVKNVHVYSMNKPEVATAIHSHLKGVK